MRARIETKNGRIRSMFHDVLQFRTSLLVTLVCCMMIVLVADSRRVDAQEVVTVQDILTDPALFHLRQITLRGTVRNVQSLDPYEIPAGSTCYGGYLFTLEDDTADSEALTRLINKLQGAATYVGAIRDEFSLTQDQAQGLAVAIGARR